MEKPLARVLLLATTTGYQTRAFGDAAERLGVDLIFATNRCSVLEDPWRDAALPIRFHDERASVRAILDAAAGAPIEGIVAVGDRPTVIAAQAAAALGLPGHPPGAAAAAGHKVQTRERLRDAGLPVPWFLPSPICIDPRTLLHAVRYPAVVKPAALSGSRGVMRADGPETLVAAFERLQRLLQSPDIREERREAHDVALVEGFVEGREFALEGLMHEGVVHALALFDKPDPLDGPFFEESVYLTPSAAPRAVEQAIESAVTDAARALGLWHGPIHAECRVNDRGVFVLEVAARPIGGLCARALRFVPATGPGPAAAAGGAAISLEELLLRHALGERPDAWRLEAGASGVMMIPIPRRGILRRVRGLEAARGTACVTDVRITAKPDQMLVPLPEGASYLGFIFARAAEPPTVDAALRAAHACLEFSIDSEVRVLQSGHG
jgi:hypothetical protein